MPLPPGPGSETLRLFPDRKGKRRNRRLRLLPKTPETAFPKFGSFRRFQEHPPPLSENFGSFRTASERPHSRETASAFSVGASTPSGSGNRKGREDGGEVDQGKGNVERARVPALSTWLSGWGKGKKRRADLEKGVRRLRETKAASGVKSARGRCGGCQRGFVRLRRVEEAGRETGFCACVEAGLRRGCSAAPEWGPVPGPPTRLRKSFPSSREGAASDVANTSGRPIITLYRLLAETSAQRCPAPHRRPLPEEVIESRLLPPCL
ncbi:uncharacterized protein LOC130838199 [Hippopotamus amphibius kiboko]|uniref:uncharacterized protein LOC130838199 n=1 Tax=Hippopotamus amphibius kiboko TaxID=575201 RepID=UPI0025914F2A|nr:uncharacterized protein LOC130838199 [Hippopotamus amphibius kiboko]